MGPWIVVYCLCSGAYRLAELNGAVSHLKFAAFCLVLYYPRSRKIIPVMKIVDASDLEQLDDDEDGMLWMVMIFSEGERVTRR